MGFIGANGAGKTTTLKSILNIVKPDSGTVEIFGENIVGNELELKQRIGFMYGEADYYKHKRVGVVVAVARAVLRGMGRRRLPRLSSSASGSTRRSRSPNSPPGCGSSSPSRSRFRTMRDLFIFDEPTSGPDPVARAELLELFHEIVEDGQKSILFSTHITSDLDKCADFIVFIRDGEIIANTTKDDLIAAHALVSAQARRPDGRSPVPARRRAPKRVRLPHRPHPPRTACGQPTRSSARRRTSRTSWSITTRGRRSEASPLQGTETRHHPRHLFLRGLRAAPFFLIPAYPYFVGVSYTVMSFLINFWRRPRQQGPRVHGRCCRCRGTSIVLAKHLHVLILEGATICRRHPRGAGVRRSCSIPAETSVGMDAKQLSAFFGSTRLIGWHAAVQSPVLLPKGFKTWIQGRQRRSPVGMIAYVAFGTLGRIRRELPSRELQAVDRRTSIRRPSGPSFWSSARASSSIPPGTRLSYRLTVRRFDKVSLVEDEPRPPGEIGSSHSTNSCSTDRGADRNGRTLAATPALPSIRDGRHPNSRSDVTIKKGSWGMQLEAKGFIYSRAGKGCFVAAPPTQPIADAAAWRFAAERLKTEMAYYVSLGLTRDELLELITRIFPESASND
ncbi:MAG: ATP-binding cassette domain-containing protein [Candidatus Moduliflexus flocculans]|nr:ATP-binding cassette domain-containing protein [Candidatus Moduliflexus flocculans]